jgi:predicted phosphodiesterase
MNLKETAEKETISRRSFIGRAAVLSGASLTPALFASAATAVNTSILGTNSETSTATKQPILKFNANKKFKIVQFTDTHIKYGNPKSDIALQRMEEVLKAEKPDLVVYTGDIIYAKPAEEGLRAALAPAVALNIPIAMTFGNHDDEHDMSREALYKILQSTPNSVTSNTQGLSGVGNYILSIQSAQANKEALSLFCMDSHSYSKIKGVRGYDYIKQDQVTWYLDQSNQIKQRNNGETIPALAFFHIPLPEYHEAVADENSTLIGHRREKVCSPDLNSGMFTAMKQAGNMMGVFVGHDHDNDYAAYWKGILLCYGRYTGGDTVYNNLTNGARVIELTEGEKGFKTWIHLADNKIEQVANFPADFTKKK